MTRDDILRMAREVGLLAGTDMTSDRNLLLIAGLEHFAKAIEAQVQDEYTNSIQKWTAEGEVIVAKAGVGFHLGAWWADRPWRKRT